MSGHDEKLAMIKLMINQESPARPSLALFANFPLIPLQGPVQETAMVYMNSDYRHFEDSGIEDSSIKE